jgi:hypothetical protein
MILPLSPPRWGRAGVGADPITTNKQPTKKTNEQKNRRSFNQRFLFFQQSTQSPTPHNALNALMPPTHQLLLLLQPLPSHQKRTGNKYR